MKNCSLQIEKVIIIKPLEQKTTFTETPYEICHNSICFMVNLLNYIYEKSTMGTKISEVVLSDKILVRQGVRQDYTISSMLFTALGYVFKQLNR